MTERWMTREESEARDALARYLAAKMHPKGDDFHAAYALVDYRYWWRLIPLGRRIVLRIEWWWKYGRGPLSVARWIGSLPRPAAPTGEEPPR